MNSATDSSSTARGFRFKPATVFAPLARPTSVPLSTRLQRRVVYGGESVAYDERTSIAVGNSFSAPRMRAFAGFGFIESGAVNVSNAARIRLPCGGSLRLDSAMSVATPQQTAAVARAVPAGQFLKRKLREATIAMLASESLVPLGSGKRLREQGRHTQTRGEAAPRPNTVQINRHESQSAHHDFDTRTRWRERARHCQRRSTSHI